jgi:hypothetical protein
MGVVGCGLLVVYHEFCSQDFDGFIDKMATLVVDQL